jgi:hypothetical protein
VIVRRPRLVELARQNRENLLALLAFSKMFEFSFIKLMSHVGGIDLRKVK